MAGGGGDLTYVNVVFNKMHKTATQHSSRGEGNHSMSEGVGGVASCVKMLIYEIIISPPPPDENLLYACDHKADV